MSSRRPTRKAKLKDIDYATLVSGDAIPTYSSSSSSQGEASDSEYEVSDHKRRRTAIDDESGKPSVRTKNSRRKSKKKRDCFVCHRVCGSPFVQCDVCHRWYHNRCRPALPSGATLGANSCRECLNDSLVTARGLSQPRPNIKSLSDVGRAIQRARKILVIAGAGISVSCGIPDFRSPNGVYAMVEHMGLDLPDPQCVFDIEYFRRDPSPFYQVVRSVFNPTTVAPSPTHRFLKLLQDQGKLLRVYTQNIDGLEEKAGVTKSLACHGSFARSKCLKCGIVVPTESLSQAIQAGVVPTCSIPTCRGILKPQITFFGEKLPEFVSASITKDRLEADLLLILGTSLKVAPVSEIPAFLPTNIPQIVINKTPIKRKKKHRNKEANFKDEDDVEEEDFEMSLLGECDQVVRSIADMCGWKMKGGPGKKARVSCEHHEHKKSGICFDRCGWMPQKQVTDNGQTVITIDDSDESDRLDEPVVGIRCDGCDSEIVDPATPYYTCNVCFDYDLCAACYPRRSLRHKKGAHSFARVSLHQI